MAIIRTFKDKDWPEEEVTQKQFEDLVKDHYNDLNAVYEALREGQTIQTPFSLFTFRPEHNNHQQRSE